MYNFIHISNGGIEESEFFITEKEAKDYVIKSCQMFGIGELPEKWTNISILRPNNEITLFTQKIPKKYSVSIMFEYIYNNDDTNLINNQIFNSEKEVVDYVLKICEDVKKYLYIFESEFEEKEIDIEEFNKIDINTVNTIDKVSRYFKFFSDIFDTGTLFIKEM